MKANDNPPESREKGRWMRGVEQRPSVTTLTSGFAAHMAGTLFLMSSVYIMLAGVLLVSGSMGSGWSAHIVGVGLILGGAALFAAGRWLTLEFSAKSPR